MAGPGKKLPYDRATLTWLDRFQISLEAESEILFGHDWRISVDPDRGKVCVARAGSEPICVPLHPGMHVLTPIWAAHRYADQLHLAAISQGVIEPPKGSAASDEVI